MADNVYESKNGDLIVVGSDGKITVTHKDGSKDEYDSSTEFFVSAEPKEFGLSPQQAASAKAAAQTATTPPAARETWKFKDEKQDDAVAQSLFKDELTNLDLDNDGTGTIEDVDGNIFPAYIDPNDNSLHYKNAQGKEVIVDKNGKRTVAGTYDSSAKPIVAAEAAKAVAAKEASTQVNPFDVARKAEADSVLAAYGFAGDGNVLQRGKDKAVVGADGRVTVEHDGKTTTYDSIEEFMDTEKLVSADGTKHKASLDSDGNIVYETTQGEKITIDKKQQVHVDDQSSSSLLDKSKEVFAENKFAKGAQLAEDAGFEHQEGFESAGVSVYKKDGQTMAIYNNGKVTITNEKGETVTTSYSSAKDLKKAFDDAKKTADIIRKAGVGQLGTDEDAIYNALKGKSAAEIELIKAQYKKATGKDMEEDMKSELGEDELKKYGGILKKANKDTTKTAAAKKKGTPDGQKEAEPDQSKKQIPPTSVSEIKAVAPKDAATLDSYFKTLDKQQIAGKMNTAHLAAAKAALKAKGEYKWTDSSGKEHNIKVDKDGKIWETDKDGNGVVISPDGSKAEIKSGKIKAPAQTAPDGKAAPKDPTSSQPIGATTVSQIKAVPAKDTPGLKGYFKSLDTQQIKGRINKAVVAAAKKALKEKGEFSWTDKHGEVHNIKVDKDGNIWTTDKNGDGTMISPDGKTTEILDGKVDKPKKKEKKVPKTKAKTQKPPTGLKEAIGKIQGDLASGKIPPKTAKAQIADIRKKLEAQGQQISKTAISYTDAMKKKENKDLKEYLEQSEKDSKGIFIDGDSLKDMVEENPPNFKKIDEYKAEKKAEAISSIEDAHPQAEEWLQLAEAPTIDPTKDKEGAQKQAEARKNLASNSRTKDLYSKMTKDQKLIEKAKHIRGNEAQKKLEQELDALDRKVDFENNFVNNQIKQNEIYKSAAKYGAVAGQVAGVVGKAGRYSALSNLLMPDTTKTFVEFSNNKFLQAWSDLPGAVSAEICEAAEEKMAEVPGRTSSFYRTASGSYQFAGSIQADKSSQKIPIVCEVDPKTQEESCPESLLCKKDGFCYKSKSDTKPETGFFYKITWGVTAPTDEKHTPFIDENGYAVKFNVQLQGSKNKWIYAGDDGKKHVGTMQLENGNNHGDVLAKYMTKDYNRVCIIFHPQHTPKGQFGDDVEEICADFVSKKYIKKEIKKYKSHEGAIGNAVADI